MIGRAVSDRKHLPHNWHSPDVRVLHSLSSERVLKLNSVDGENN